MNSRSRTASLQFYLIILPSNHYQCTRIALRMIADDEVMKSYLISSGHI